MRNFEIDKESIAENDHLRSKHIREIFQNTTQIKNSSTEVYIPRIIIQFWHDKNNIPKDVQDCIDSWKILEGQGFKRLLFDDNIAREFILKELGNTYANAFDRCHHPAMRCDYFRLCYIFLVGGFYVDADEVYQGADCNYLFQNNNLKVQPFCYDISTDSMINPEIFIKQKKYSKDWIFYVNNNPIIAPPKHYLILLALERATKLLLESDKEQLDIQSTTGPGNLSASLVRYSIECRKRDIQFDFSILSNWESISQNRWFLSYRNDNRNWRIWNAKGLWRNSIL